MQQLYPIKFKPILKEKIWGGNRLKEKLGKQGKCQLCGESWEISAVQGEISVVENGFLKNNSLEEIIEVYMGDLVGDKIYERFGIEFPLLIKFIDANDDLSIQVHPGDEMAEKRHNSYGKTEMWYIVDAEKDASLVSGFNKPLDKTSYIGHLENNILEMVLNRVPVAKGDAFFIPAGRIHSLGAGILLTEIQQTSDITYRIYDWERVDDKGKPRELHTDLAVDAIDFRYVEDVKTSYINTVNKTVNLVKCEYFTTNKLHFNMPIERDYYDIDSFVIYICINGKFDIQHEVKEYLEVIKGQTVLIPASLKSIALIPKNEAEILEVYIE